MNHFRQFLHDSCNFDSAHDITHTERVVSNALLLAEQEKCDREVVIAASWLHDCVIVTKDHPDRKKASTLAAEKATIYLKSIHFHREKISEVAHAIESHSFSAGIQPKTTEAKIVQDADRLDALGAIGIARCFMVGGQMNRSLCHPEDPFCLHRDPDDKKWTADHFYAKLFKLPELMNLESAKTEAIRRVNFMRQFLERMDQEINPPKKDQIPTES